MHFLQLTLLSFGLPPPPQLAREVCLHMRSCHPSITALYAAYKDARYIYLLMELAPSGNLYQMLMAMPVPAVSTHEHGHEHTPYTHVHMFMATFVLPHATLHGAVCQG